MNRITASLPGTTIDPRYPESDGRFMGETEYHNDAQSQIREVVEDHLADLPNVLVASNLVMYYKKGDPKSRKDPDVLVAKGVIGDHKRLSYRVWEEKQLPRVLFEVTSRKTWRNDIGEKRELYARLRIREYFVFDPHFRYLNPPLQGFRSINGKSIAIEWTEQGLFSKELGLFLTTGHDMMLRFIDPQTGKRLLTRRERIERAELFADLERERADLERARADLAHRRATDLADEIEKLKARITKLET
jgi:Uma2 family endonuclease